MVKSSSTSKNEIFDDSFCTTSCKKNIESINTKITKLSEKLSDTDCPGVIKNNKNETAKKSPVKYAEMYRNTSKSLKVRGNQRNWNNLMNQRLGSNFVMKNKACFKCGHFDRLAYDCGVWVKKGKSWPKKNFAHKNVTPRCHFFKTTSVSVVRCVNTAAPRPNVNSTQPKTTQDLAQSLLRITWSKFHHLSDHDEEEEIAEDDNPNKTKNVPEIFKIEGNLFDFETPLCEAFNEVNYLLKIDADLFTYNVQNFKTYDEYKRELKNDIAKGPEEPWNRKPMEETKAFKAKVKGS
nr:VIER F-box protein 2 [Tanacetum cinerariifolium]